MLKRHIIITLVAPIDHMPIAKGGCPYLLPTGEKYKGNLSSLLILHFEPEESNIEYFRRYPQVFEMN
jgi:hypothetical protein